MAYLGAHFTEISDSGSKGSKLAQDLKDRFASLYKEAQALLGSDWNGASAKVFDDAQIAFNGEADKLADAHDQLGRAVAQFSDDLHGTDIGPASQALQIGI